MFIFFHIPDKLGLYFGQSKHLSLNKSEIQSMACSVQGLVPTFSGPSYFSSSTSYGSSVISRYLFPENGRKIYKAKRIGRKMEKLQVCKAMVQQQAVQGASATYAKEMERLSAKESLLLAFKDAGGFEALVTGKTTDIQRIDVNERITSLERLNPTPRPTTSPFLEGRWNFEWLGTGSPGLFAARFIFERFPSSLANFSKMDVLIKDGNSKITAKLKFLNSIESKFILSTKLSVEGPLRMKEEYAEVVIESPTVDEATIPEQLKGAFGQAATTVQQLPAPIKDAVSNGLKVPLSGTYQRLFMVSYLDEEILIMRDTAGIPEVLTRLDTSPSPLDAVTEYES